MHSKYDEIQARTALNFLNEKVMINFIEFFRLFYSKEIYFLMSFPRSGNGWIRYLITEALLVSKGVDLEDSKRSTYMHNNINAHRINTKSGQSFGIEDYFPDYYAIDQKKWREKYIKENSLQPEITYIKTHHLVFREDIKIVHLYRNPKDVCLSYFYLLNLTNEATGYDGNGEYFINYFKQSIKLYLDVYCKVLRFYYDKANENITNLLLSRMEDMVNNGEECFSDLLEFLQIDISKKDRIAILKRNPKLETIKKDTKINLQKIWDEELGNYAQKAMQLYSDPNKI
jgi:hypothetical protein